MAAGRARRTPHGTRSRNTDFIRSIEERPGTIVASPTRRCARRARASAHEDRRRRHDRAHRANQVRTRTLLPIRRTDVGRHPGRSRRRTLGQVGLPRAVGGRAQGRFTHARDARERSGHTWTVGAVDQQRTRLLLAPRRRRIAAPRDRATTAPARRRHSHRCRGHGATTHAVGQLPWEVDTYATTTPADAVVMATPAHGDRPTPRRARPGPVDISPTCAAPARR